MKPHHTLYFFSFAASLLLHISFLEGTFTLLKPLPTPPPTPEQQREPLRLKFIESLKETESEPDEPTDLISDASNKASQVEESPDKSKPKDAPEVSDIKEAKHIQTVESKGTKSATPTPPAPTPSPPQESAQINITEQVEIKKERQSPIQSEQTSEAEIKIQTARVIAEKTPDNDTEIIENIPADTIAQDTLPPAKPQPDTLAQSLPAPSGQSLDGKIDELVHNYSSDVDSLAEILGTIQFNITEHSMGEYVARAYKKIARQWKLRINRYYGSELFSNYAFIVFKIDADGNIVFSKLLENVGKPYFGDDCLASVHSSAKFEPLPKDYINKSGEKELWMYARFGYDVR